MADVERIYGIQAARAGLTFWEWVDGETGLDAAPTVLTGMLRHTATGYRDIVAGFHAHLNTASDWLEFQIVVTANADGSGAVTVLTPMLRIESATNNDASSVILDDLLVPLCIKDTDGGAWTIRAQTSDAAASITVSVFGWRERY